MNYTPEVITSLKGDEIFVFGSTLRGAHRGGAAKMAVEKFGAVMGQGKGLQGQSYAIPSMLKTVSQMQPYVTEFIKFARHNSQWKFYVTKIGCGRAGFDEKDVAPLFADALELGNVYLPESFVEILQGVAAAKAEGVEPVSVAKAINEESNAKEEVVLDGNNADESGFISTSVPQLQGVRVVGKIDLSNMPARSKTYIIDTNVFIDCPDIINKIPKRDKIILSAKVVDELDAAKVRLDEHGKMNASRALKLINSQLKPRKIEMVCADLSLLPIDFVKTPDNMILSVAMKYKDQNAIMLTSDNGLQIKSKGLGIKTITLKEFL